jgi:hypothetical protein
MKLDSFDQYYIRKMLRRHLQSPGCRVSGKAEIAKYFNTDLNLLIIDSCSSLIAIPSKLQKIAGLIQAHQDQKTNQYSLQTQFAIEQQIFNLIGLKLYATKPVTLLEIIEEHRVIAFRFLLRSEICQGVRYKDNIYGLVSSFKLESDPRMLKLILILLGRGIPFIITHSVQHSVQHHAIWINLKSPAYAALITYGSRLINKTLPIHNCLQRFKADQSAKVQGAADFS